MADLAGERIVVTGGAGFIGRHVVRALTAAGAAVTVADRRASPDDGVRAVVGDLREPDAIERAVADGTTEIVHLAALTSVLESRQRPVEVYETNVAVTAGLLERARGVGVDRFLLASTNAVTGDVGDRIIDEDVPPRPLTPYGATKAAGEMLLSGYAGYGLGTCSLRLTNVYGPGMNAKDSFVPRLMRAALTGATVEVYGDGSQRRDLVHVDDVCRGLLAAWRGRWTGPLVVGAGRSVSVLDIVEAVRAVTGRDVPTRHVPAKPGEMPAVVVSIDRARALGYTPQVSLADGLATVWDEVAGAPEVWAGVRDAVTAPGP